MRTYALSLVLLSIVGLAGCAKNMNRQIRDAVGHFDNADLSSDKIEVLSTHELGGQAVAEVRIKTAFKLSKKNGRWVVDEVRIGDRRWEKADHILAVLRSQRTETTRKQLQSIGDAVRHYAEQQGAFPQVSTFKALIEVLTPEYLPEVIALDAWSNAYAYRRLSPGAAEIRSDGPDGLYGTPDDLIQRIEE